MDNLSFRLSFAVAIASILVSNFFVRKRRAAAAGASTTSTDAELEEPVPRVSTSPIFPIFPPGSRWYQVFLSFHGQDTRKGFTDHLYHGLVHAGICVFRDDNNLHVGGEIGPELRRAISESKISIPILSQGYASSDWCLNELSQMIERRRSSRHIVLPIFYNVKPSHVRHQTGSFGKAFNSLRKNFGPEIVKEWEQALKDVTSMKGWESEEITNRYEGELIKLVVETVTRELKEDFQLHVPEQLVGVEDHVGKIIKMMDINSRDPQMIGIYGIGGIGKTTLAKCIFNKLSDQFVGLSFIPDVRGKDHQYGIEYIQKQLIFDVLKRDYQVCTVDEGINTIKSRFSSKKVLVLLDDVDNESQLNYLTGKRDWFGFGSRIIVTTRDVAVLRKAEFRVVNEYELEVMSPELSLLLFSIHAFQEYLPPNEFMVISRDIVETTGGLPLVLQVIGSLLLGEMDMEVWTDTLLKLRKAPAEQVQEKLKISYDALDNEAKQIFLDIACFFVDCENTFPIYMWDSLNFAPRMQIPRLMRRLLVKIEQDRFKMHVQLRDLGRNIADQEDYDESKYRSSRLSTYEDVLRRLDEHEPPQPSGSSTSPAGGDSPEDPSPGPSSSDHHVFLSFRGTDTRNGFTDHLYHALNDAGIVPLSIFRDDKNLEFGKNFSGQLLDAVTQSKILIPIISKNYASSKWCLLELIQMVECTQSSRQKILPIFYHVDPADVKHLTGAFGKEFHLHKKRLKGVDIVKAEQALKEVGHLPGYSEKTTNGFEADLVKVVVKKVLIEFKQYFQLDVPEHLVGIKVHVEEIMRLLDPALDDTRMIGIHGIGGVGKTTLAKVVHNKLCNEYDEFLISNSFIADIRETSQKKGLEHVQRQLISDVLKRDHEVHNTDRGVSEIKDGCERKKVLITLDDVDSKDHLDALARRSDWFGPGSRIIITTRNENVLDFGGFTQRYNYELKELSEKEALLLFSKHAFGTDSPPDEFKHISDDIVATTGFLPLTLEVIGSYLKPNKSMDIWKETFQKSKEAPDKKVQNILKISYDALEFGQKQIFLDIACFFIGMDQRFASYMWDACKFFPSSGMEELKNRSLVKIRDNELRMHDQLRDLGREIVRKEDYMEPMNRSRLWVYEDAFKVLCAEKETKMIQAIRLIEKRRDKLSYPEGKIYKKEQFEKMPSLRFLHLNAVDFRRDSGTSLCGLRWLQLENCPTFSASNFCLEKLVVLNLSRSTVSDLWGEWGSSFETMTQLKVFKLTEFPHLEHIGDLSAFESLKILIIERCPSLEKIHSSIGGMKNLLVLNLRYCGSLKELPADVGRLEKLKELAVDGTDIEEIPESIGDLKTLEMFSAVGCESLTKIADSIGHAVNLLTLRLKGAFRLTNLPISIGKLELLTELDLSGSGITKLPESIRNLQNLRILNIQHFMIRKLTSAIGSLGKLQELNASFCRKLTGNIPSSIGELSLLKILRLAFTDICCVPDTIGNLSSLEHLDLLYCSRLRSLPEPPSGLRVLRVTCQNCTLPRLSHLKHLKLLVLGDCQLLKHMPELPSYSFQFRVWGSDKLDRRG